MCWEAFFKSFSFTILKSRKRTSEQCHKTSASAAFVSGFCVSYCVQFPEPRTGWHKTLQNIFAHCFTLPQIPPPCNTFPFSVPPPSSCHQTHPDGNKLVLWKFRHRQKQKTLKFEKNIQLSEGGIRFMFLWKKALPNHKLVS